MYLIIYLNNIVWIRVILGKYRQQKEGWCSKEGREGYGVGVQKAIRSSQEALKEKTGFKVGSTNRMKFRIDKWCGDTILRDLFPTLYSIVSSKYAWMKEVWDSDSWSLRFVRQLHDWELKEVDAFFERLYNHSISLDSEDTMV